MDANMIKIDASDLLDILAAVLVRRLRDLKWSSNEAARASEKALTIVFSRMDDLCVEAAQDMARMAGNGSNEQMMQVMARAVFAMEGMRIADELNKARIASMN